MIYLFLQQIHAAYITYDYLSCKCATKKYLPSFFSLFPIFGWAKIYLLVEISKYLLFFL